MKKMTKVLLATAVLPVVLGSSSAFAKGHGDDDSRGKRDRDDSRFEQCERHDSRGMMRDLDLTAEQRDKMRDLREAARDDMQKERDAHRDQMRALHQQEGKLMLGANFDEKAAQELAKQMVDIQAAKRVEMMKHRYEMMSILTPEQKAKFAELQEKQMANMDECDAKPGHDRDDHRSERHMGKGPRG